MHAYLNSSVARAADVAHYVDIDGRTATSPPGGVPTPAIWAGVGTPGRTIGGATNVTIPNQTHVQSATSAESFAEFFEFFTGQPPATTDVEPEPPGQVEIAGRAVIFPLNIGVEDAALELWELHGDAGRRKNNPAATVAINGDGSWGPLKAKGGKHYEFALLRNGVATHHFYYEPFRRSDHLVRLLTSVPNTGLDALVDKSDDNHVAVVVTRNKELWGDQGAANDLLEINGTNVCNAATCPIGKRVIAMFAHDDGSDGISDLSAPLGPFFAQPFISGVDLFIPAATPPTGDVAVRLTSRGSRPVRTVNFPNFPSTTDRATVQFNDFE